MIEATCLDCFNIFDENHLSPVNSGGKIFKLCPKCYMKHQGQIMVTRNKVKKKKYTTRRNWWTKISYETKLELAKSLVASRVKKQAFKREEIEKEAKRLGVTLKSSTIYQNINKFIKNEINNGNSDFIIT